MSRLRIMVRTPNSGYVMVVVKGNHPVTADLCHKIAEVTAEVTENMRKEGGREAQV